MNKPIEVLFTKGDRASLLQDELLNVISHPKYDGLDKASVIGVLEFLKWNLINIAT